jgi:hypothetical protein
MVIRKAKREFKKMETFCYESEDVPLKSSINSSATIEFLLEELEKK